MSRGIHSLWHSGTAAERGAYTTTGLGVPFNWWETDTALHYWWNGSAWVTQALGTGTATRVAYWSDANTLTSHANFTYTAGGPLHTQAATATNRALTVQTTDNNTTLNLTEWLNSVGTVIAGVGAQGHAAFGTNTVYNAYVLTVNKIFTNPSLDPVVSFYYGVNATVSYYPTNNTVAGWRGFGVGCITVGGGGFNIGSLWGGYFNCLYFGTATLTNQTGGQFEVQDSISSGTSTTTTAITGAFAFTKSGAGTWTVGTAKLLDVRAPVVSAGTLNGTLLYGVYIGDFGAPGGTWGTKYAIYAAGGNSYHAGQLAIGGTVAPAAQAHVDQSSTTAAIPALILDQADVSEEFTRYIGAAAAGVLTQSIVDEGDQASETREGWLKVYVVDDGNQIADQAYYIPIYSLSA